MNKKEALETLEKYHRWSIEPEFAERIAKAFGCKLSRKLVRTTRGYRESIEDETVPRVNTSALAEDICKQLNITPDKKLMETANKMHGIGSQMNLATKACVKVLS